MLIEAADGKITMTTTDLDISIKSVCDCEVVSPGKTTLPVKLLFNAVAKSEEGGIEIEVDGKECARITAGHARFRLVGMPASDFPKLPSDEDAYSYSVPQQTVKEMLRKVAYAASQDDTRRTLKCVLMRFKDEKLTMVATDGRRLALVENEIEFPKSDELPAEDVCAWEKTALDLAASSGIRVPESRLLRVGGRSVLLLKRFDSKGNSRAHYGRSPDVH